MDQDLIAYLDERFRETSRQIEVSREETSRQIEASREETTRQIETSREETSQQIVALREETTSRLDRVENRLERVDGRLKRVEGHLDRVEEGVRHTQVSLEGLRGEVRLVAEGIMGLDERLGFLREDMSQKIDEADSFLRLSYTDMDSHIKESDKFFRASLAELNARIRPIEGWQERYGRDPVALVREKYGKKPDPPV